MTKFIFVTGGVVSSLGKGITAASLGRLLKDRVLLFSPYYTSEVESDVLQLIDLDVDLVLICNNPKRDDFPNHLIHYVNLSTPRPIVYTEDYDKIIQPHPMALNYIYYDIYTQMIEMTRDLDL